MKLFRIKICGVTHRDDLLTAIESGADGIGLNFYQKSVRSVSASEAVRLVESTKSLGAQARPKFVGVFVNHSAQEIAETVLAVGLDAVQLHGDERPAAIKEIRDALRSGHGGPGTIVIRAIRLGDQGTGCVSAENLNDEVNAWANAGAAAVLLDPAVPGAYGGTGHRLDWAAIGAIELGLPVILAGGLNADNVAQAIEAAEPFAVDVASGVEGDDHRKDGHLVRRFVTQAKSAFGLD